MVKRGPKPFALNIEHFDFSATSACLIVRPAIAKVHTRTMRIYTQEDVIKIANLLGPVLHPNGSPSDMRVIALEAVRAFVAAPFPYEPRFDDADLFSSVKYGTIAALPSIKALAKQHVTLMREIGKVKTIEELDEIYDTVKAHEVDNPRTAAVAAVHSTPTPTAPPRRERQKLWCDNHGQCFHTTAQCRNQPKRNTEAPQRQSKQPRHSSTQSAPKTDNGWNEARKSINAVTEGGEKTASTTQQDSNTVKVDVHGIGANGERVPMQALIDTGAERSLISLTKATEMGATIKPTNVQLNAVNNQPLGVKGTTTIMILLPNVKHPLPLTATVIADSDVNGHIVWGADQIWHRPDNRNVSLIAGYEGEPTTATIGTGDRKRRTRSPRPRFRPPRRRRARRRRCCSPRTPRVASRSATPSRATTCTCCRRSCAPRTCRPSPIRRRCANCAALTGSRTRLW